MAQSPRIVSNKCIAVRKVATPLRELTCHMGSHSVTCHPAEVTFPPLPQPKLVLVLATPEGCKAELTCVCVDGRWYRSSTGTTHNQRRSDAIWNIQNYYSHVVNGVSDALLSSSSLFVCLSVFCLLAIYIYTHTYMYNCYLFTICFNAVICE